MINDYIIYDKGKYIFLMELKYFNEDENVKEDLIVIEHDLYNLYCGDFLIRSLFPEYKQAYMMFIINLN